MKNKLIDISNDFTVSHFTFSKGSITKFDEGRYNIEVPISKFILDDKTIATSLRLDFIRLPNKLETYIGEKITFPVNPDRKSTRLNSSHVSQSRMPSSA